MDGFEILMAALAVIGVIAMDYNSRRTYEKWIAETRVKLVKTPVTIRWARWEPWLRYSGMASMALSIILIRTSVDPIVWAALGFVGVLLQVAAPSWRLVEWKR